MSARSPIVPKLRRELTRYAVVSAYLYVCFGALIFYKAAVLHAYGVDFPVWGLAIAKALVLGKFVMTGQAFGVGERQREKPLIYGIVYKVIMFVVLLFALSVIEKIVVAAIHGRPIREAISRIAGATWPEVLASCLLLCLVLTPYFGLAAINGRLEEGRLRKMFFG